MTDNNAKSTNLPGEKDVSGNKKGYEESLKGIEVSRVDKKKHLLNSIKDVASGAFVENIPGIKQTLEIYEEYNRNIEHQKQIAVFNELFNRVQDLEETKERLLELLTDHQYGLVLFNKYKRISESMPFIDDGITILSNTLETLVEGNFQEKFSQHNYFLELIDKLSIQALILLMDHKNWPEQLTLSPSGRHVLGQAIIEDWYIHFAEEYNDKSGKKLDVQLLELAVRELYSNGLFIIYQDGRDHSVILTLPGASLLSYLSNK
jgi:hypothetical protein